MAENPSDLAHYQSDHDLLVVLNERVSALTTAVESKSLDHEARIRAIEAKLWIFAGAAAAVGGAGGYGLSNFL